MISDELRLLLFQRHALTVELCNAGTVVVELWVVSTGNLQGSHRWYTLKGEIVLAWIRLGACVGSPSIIMITE